MRTVRCEQDPSRIHPELERWARDEGWESYNALQEKSFQLILGTNDDVIISGRTAGGKTEAAFLPLLSRAARRRTGVSVLCINPTKALINDQHRRLSAPADRVGVPIYKWHGEAPQSGKQRLLRDRRGVVFITPESLEGWFIRRPRILKELFSDLDAIVIDELHEFLDGARGHQLSSLLARVDLMCKKRPRRIALSATLGDIEFARRWICLHDQRSVKLVQVTEGRQPLRSRIKGYVAPPVDEPKTDKSALNQKIPTALSEIEGSLFERLRSGTHLVFAGSRANVERLCSGLMLRCDRAQVDNCFVPHHGSIAKEPREAVEERLKNGVPTTALATNTLQDGVDIGPVDSVELIGAPDSVTDLRQCIGRSGRRERPAAVCIHVTEKSLGSARTLMQRLRIQTARACAALNLIEKGFIEPPKLDGTMWSVVLQQILSLTKERNGVLFSQIQALMHSVAAFSAVNEKSLRALLTKVCEPDTGFLEWTSEGRFILTERGERLVHSSEFYATFRTSDQWDVVSGQRKVGWISLANPLSIGDRFRLGGKPWQVVNIDPRHNRVYVLPAAAGRIPFFDIGLWEEVHEEIASEMRRILEGTTIPEDLDRLSAKHLAEGRAEYASADLKSRTSIPDGDDCQLFTWKGTGFNRLLAMTLAAKGFVCASNEVGVSIAATRPKDAEAALARDLPDLPRLSLEITHLEGNYDRHVPEELLRENWIKRHTPLEVDVHEFCKSLVDAHRSPSKAKGRAMSNLTW